MTVYKFMLTGLFTLAFACIYGQKKKDLSPILKRIEYEDNIENYNELKREATIPQLVELTSDSDELVACYAGWALIDKSFNNLPSILIKFLKRDAAINTSEDFMGNNDPISFKFYHWYRTSVRKKKKATDKILFTLDSIILYTDKSYFVLIELALANRVYSGAFIKRIEYLAFTKTNKDAITYLMRLNQKAYEEPIKQAKLKYFEKADFRNECNYWCDMEYLMTLDDLLNHNDDELKLLVIKQLKRDTFWKRIFYDEVHKQNFIEILEKHNIQLKDIQDCGSQTGTIKGYFQKPFSGANIFLIDHKMGTKSDTNISAFNGNFNLTNIPTGTYDMRISYSGFPDTTLTSIKVSKDTIINLYIAYPPSCKYNINNDTCPVCKKKDQVISIVYGYPSEETLEASKRGSVKIGVCMVTDCDPNWYCKRDKKEF